MFMVKDWESLYSEYLAKQSDSDLLVALDALQHVEDCLTLEEFNSLPFADEIWYMRQYINAEIAVRFKQRLEQTGGPD